MNTFVGYYDVDLSELSEKEKWYYDYCFLCDSSLDYKYSALIASMKREKLLTDDFVPICCFCYSLLYHPERIIDVVTLDKYKGVVISLLGADGSVYSNTINTEDIEELLRKGRKDIVIEILNATKKWFSYKTAFEKATGKLLL